MFGWRMEEEAKIQFTITANWQREDGSEIVDGISFHRAPGHSIDHAILLLRSDDAEAVFGGDTLRHPVEIYEPDLVSMFCEFPTAARISRRSMLEHLADSEAIYFSSHSRLRPSGK